LKGFSLSGLRFAGRELDRSPGPRRLLVQWVPHGFGYKSLNLPFCLWLWQRAHFRGDFVELMVHEPYVPFQKGSWRQNGAAIVHRLMMVVLLRAAKRVWLATPAWEQEVRPFDWGRRRDYLWLPVPSNVPAVEDAAAIGEIRERYAPSGLLAGHFGTYGPAITPLLREIVPSLLRRCSDLSMLLIGRDSDIFQASLLKECPDLEGRVHATRRIDVSEHLSPYLSACDLLLQPYPDGVNTRRGTIMAALSHGRPTITTIGWQSEPLWKTSGGLALVPAEDRKAFVDVALGLIASPEQRASLAAAGRELYRRQFDIRNIVDLVRSQEGPAGN
jgi:hypothetical protein